MNPRPDLSKEYLPPKKREFQQLLSDRPVPEDDFKPPAPFRSRGQHNFTQGQRERKNFMPLPSSTLPPQPMPWQMPYTPFMHHSYMPIHWGERQGSGLASWREMVRVQGLEKKLSSECNPPQSHRMSGIFPPHNAQQFFSMPTFKRSYPPATRQMWPYDQSQQDSCPSLFSPRLYSQQTVNHHQDTYPESRHRYQDRRPEAADALECTAPPLYHGCGHKPMKILNNGRKRPQEETTRQSMSRSVLSHESINSLCSPSDRNFWETPSSEVEVIKATDSQDHLVGSASQAWAQIYYALGSLCPTAHQNHRGPQKCLGAEMGWESSAGSNSPSATVLTRFDQAPSAILPHFAKGSLIELASGSLKRVEELEMEDFLSSADTLPEFHLSSCKILFMSRGPTNGFNHLQILLTDRNTQELLTVLAEYPFFVRGHGWSSCSPERSARLYGLQCRQLSAGDVCLALTPTPATDLSDAAEHSKAQRNPSSQAPPPLFSATPSPPDNLCASPRVRKRRWSAPEFQPALRTGHDLPQGSKTVRRQ